MKTREVEGSPGRWCVSKAVRIVLALIFATSRFRVRGPGARWLEAEAVPARRPVILALWHHDIVGALGYFRRLCDRGLRIRPIASASGDGALAAYVIEDLIRRNMRLARGSSRRGGQDAFATLREFLDAGESVAITVDGPRGPRHRAKRGAVRLASLTGTPIVPFGLAVRREVVLARAWDRFRIPTPGNDGRFLVGAPLCVGRALDEPALARANHRLERRLLGLAEAAARFTRHRHSLVLRRRRRRRA